MTVTKKAVPKELLDSLLADYRKPEDLIGENGLLKQLTKLLVEKALEAEMADHLGHGKNEPVENVAGNTRNGQSVSMVCTEFGLSDQALRSWAKASEECRFVLLFRGFSGASGARVSNSLARCRGLRHMIKRQYVRLLHLL